MKKMLALILLTANYLLSQSQGNMGVGTSSPNASAMLDVSSNNKGLLIPRIALTGTGDVSTIGSPATSLLVYNTTAAGSGNTAVVPGFYYWNGTTWVQLSTGAASPTGTAWLLTGNAGTVDGTNFLGTTDNVPFNIKVNNQKAGRIESSAFTGNTFWGYQAGNANNGGTNNTATGYLALYSNTTGNLNTGNGSSALYSNTSGNSNTANGFNALYYNTTGSYNTANGEHALYRNSAGSNNSADGYGSLAENTTGYNNTANGSQALGSNVTGYGNTANGFKALGSNTVGFFNTALGNLALYSNTKGDSNTAVGSGVMFYNTTGSYNTANGFNALYFNSNGNYNTAVGNYAVYQNTTGYFNTAVGSNALVSNTTGGSNTALGYGADVTLGNLINATAIGDNAKVNASNKIRLGNTSVTVIEGQVAYSFPSDARFKYNIKQDVPGLAFIKKLTPITYYFDEQRLAYYTETGKLSNNDIQPAAYSADKQLHTGFLAQDVEKIAKDLGYNFDGIHAPSNYKDHYSLAYSQFIMPIVKAIQEQQEIIEDKQKQITELKSDSDQLHRDVESLKKQVAELLQGTKNNK